MSQSHPQLFTRASEFSNRFLLRLWVWLHYLVEKTVPPWLREPILATWSLEVVFSAVRQAITALNELIFSIELAMCGDLSAFAPKNNGLLASSDNSGEFADIDSNGELAGTEIGGETGDTEIPLWLCFLPFRFFLYPPEPRQRTIKFPADRATQ